MSDLTWPEGSPRVLVTDCWLPNAGDALIAVAMERAIRAVCPGAAVLHAAYGSEEVRARYPDLALVPPLDALLGTRWAPERAHGGPELVDGADLVVSQGGGFLRAGYQPAARIDALARASRLSPRLALLGQSIGVFDRATARRDLSEILTSAVSVVTRDEASQWAVLELGAPPDRVKVGADFTISAVLDADFRAEAARRSSQRGLGGLQSDAVGVVLSGHEVP
ncbi:MAG: polysaccharide pyruvyl transferase family protein, partial [Actinobacteria bacterium]|nr:polysaccharide pyruvyl transferase family protein [Actinomycetota bacterium]MCG2803225.1 polysaccharide pyruvyl transferase family protein [Cellulomonas sp.]